MLQGKSLGAFFFLFINFLIIYIFRNILTLKGGTKMQKSLWSDTVKLPDYNSLQKDIITDVLIIGGGICGILCAHFLKKDGVDCVIVEGSKIASGITQNTTAKITSQHGLIYSNLIKKKGLYTARLYLEAHQAALKEYEKLCKNIDCDFTKKSLYIYSVDSREKIENEIKALDKIGFKASFKDEIELPIKFRGAVCFENQAQFNPLKFISELTKNQNIYENTFVREINSGKAITNNGIIKANCIIVATHFPFINKHGNYFMKLYQERSYVSAFKNAPTLDGMYLDESKNGFSFRSYEDFLLVGAGAHRTGKNSLAWKPINEFVKTHYPKATLGFQWATQDCMSLDNIAYIGKYSKNTENMYVATGFNKWGMTSSMVSAMILADMITGKENEFKSIFSPQRSMLNLQLAVNAFESAYNFILPTKKRCPHLGCALKWNKNEHTWDCPCHGSRFEERGKLINNPATKDLR